MIDIHHPKQKPNTIPMYSDVGHKSFRSGIEQDKEQDGRDTKWQGYHGRIALLPRRQYPPE